MTDNQTNTDMLTGASLNVAAALSPAPVPIATPVAQAISLADFAGDLRLRDRRHELVAAFLKKQQRDGVLFATAADYQARFDAFLKPAVR